MAVWKLFFGAPTASAASAITVVAAAAAAAVAANGAAAIPRRWAVACWLIRVYRVHVDVVLLLQLLAGPVHGGFKRTRLAQEPWIIFCPLSPCAALQVLVA